MIYVVSHCDHRTRIVDTATTSMKKAVDKVNCMFEDENFSDMQFAEIFTFEDNGETYDFISLSRSEFNNNIRVVEGKEYIIFEQEASYEK